MRTSQKGLDLIKHFEGFSSRPYICPAGWLTIGYGHLITKADADKFSMGIAAEQALALLKRDLYIAEIAVLKLIKVPLNQGEFDALVSFVFNLGAGRLKSSTLRMRLNREDRLGASREFLRWRFAGGRPVNGLLRRREAERQLFMNGSPSRIRTSVS